MSDKPNFTGNAEQKALAAQIFQLMSTQGAFFASDSPIKQTLANLADFIAVQRKADRAKVVQEIDAALSKNNAVFAREERDDDVIYVISRLGAYRPRSDESTLPVDDISVVVTTTRPALTTVEPVFISDYWQQQAGLTPVAPSDEEQEETVELLDAGETALVIEEPVATEEEEVVETAAPVTEKPVPASTSMQNTVIALPNGVQIDLRRPVADLIGQYGPTLLAQFRAALDNDPLRRIVTFGTDAFPEAAVESFGKND